MRYANAAAFRTELEQRLRNQCVLAPPVYFEAR
jgi:hypothetical protein